MNSFRKYIISEIFLHNKLRHFALNLKWYNRNNKMDVYNLIHSETMFLDKYDVSLRERIYYIENDYYNVKICSFCKSRKLKYKHSNICLTKTCSVKLCMSKLQSIITRQANKNMSQEAKQRKAKKCSVANKGRTRTPEQTEKIRQHSIGRIQTIAEKEKRINSRRNNGKPWHTENVKERISLSNKLTWSKPEYKKLKAKLTEQNKPKQSSTMKEKIKNGEFTPCITNSWTSWQSYIVEDSVKKKFRSSWEAAFYLLNANLEYEVTRIPYIYNYYKHNYIVDFTDIKNKILYEIKPNSEKHNLKNLVKVKYAKEWCKRNDYFFIIIDDLYFHRNASRIDYNTQPQLKQPMEQFL